MNSLRLLLSSCPKSLRLPPTPNISNLLQTCHQAPGLQCLQKTISTSPILSVENPKVLKMQRKHEQLMANTEQDTDVINLDALAKSENKGSKDEEDDVLENSVFSLYPDETTANQLFNGIPFKDLPYVTLKLHRNNTRLIARHADQRYIWNNAPSYHGFLNAKKRTNVAGQVAGLNMGQKLRGLGIRTIRVRINGFNAARVSTMKGIIQAGVEIVAIMDSTTVNWDTPQRPRKRPRKN